MFAAFGYYGPYTDCSGEYYDVVVDVDDDDGDEDDADDSDADNEDDEVEEEEAINLERYLAIELSIDLQYV